MGKIEEDKPSISKISINGKPANNKHRRIESTRSAQRALNERIVNEQLHELDQNDFCEWIIKCVQNLPPSKTIKIMKENIIKTHELSGKQLIKYAVDQETLRDFIQTQLECNEVFFLQYLMVL